MHEKFVLILRQLANKIDFRCRKVSLIESWKTVAEYCDRNCMIFPGIQTCIYIRISVPSFSLLD